MNFDIKYTTYLQIFNFIKIKQGLEMLRGAQNRMSIAKTLDNPGCTLGTLEKRSDNGAHSPVTEKKERKKEKESGVHKGGFSLNLTGRPHIQPLWFT